MVVKEQLITIDEFWAEYEGKRFEFVKGVPREMAPTGHNHGISSAKILIRMGVHVEAHDLGEVFGAESTYCLTPDILRAPDASFVAKSRLDQVTDPTKFTPFAPDLAVEVVSPNETARDIRDKVSDYLAAGTRLVWVIYPESRQAVVHRPDGSSQTLEEDDALDGEDVLPGLSILVSRVLPRRS